MEFHIVSELAREWGLSENLICKWAGEGKFKVGVYLNHLLSYDRQYRGIGFIPDQDIFNFVTAANCSISTFVSPDGETIALPGEMLLIGLELDSQTKWKYPCAELTSSVKIDRHTLLIPKDEFSKFKNDHPELFTRDNISTSSGDNEWARGNAEIEIESGLSFNTFKKYADLAGIKFGKEKGRPYRNEIRKSDIRRVMAFEKQY